MDAVKRKTTPIRILHVVGGMNRGGVETWLMHVLRHIDRAMYRMDFLVHTARPCAYDTEIRNLGSRIIPCLHPSRPWRYARNFSRALRAFGPYDVVHSHVHHFSGLVLRLAHREGVLMRIAHSHNDTSPVDGQARLPRRLYLRLMERWIAHHATLGLAASPEAAASLYGPHWADDPNRCVLYYGIDLAPFRERPDRAAVRRELGLPEGSFVVGHVGRFVPQKNHDFLLEIALELARVEPSMRLLLVGDGPLRPRMQERAAELGLADKVLFAGVCPDVPRLMMAAMDAFLLPSHHEGLPLVLLEAQAAGLPCTISRAISRDTDVVPGLIRRVGLDEPPAAWVAAVLDRWAGSPGQAEALAALENSPFSVRASAEHLTRAYGGA